MDPYHELGLSPQAENEPELIRAAFKALAKKYHPDGTTNPSEKAQAEEKMRRLNEAQRLILSGEYRPPRPSSHEAERSTPAPPPPPPTPTKPPAQRSARTVSRRHVPLRPVVGAALCLLLAVFGPSFMQGRHLQRAEELERQGQFQEALDEVSQAIATDSRNGQAFLLRARLWQKLGHPERAKVDLNNARTLVSPTALESASRDLSPTPNSPTPTPADTSASN